jgi:hypothetical protein
MPTNIRIATEKIIPHTLPWEAPGWTASLDRVDEIDRALRSLGGDPTRVTRALSDRIGRVVTEFPEDFAPFGEHLPPRPEASLRMGAAIQEFLLGLKFVEEGEATIVSRDVPLCVFDAPNVPHAKTTYASSMAKEETAGWSIEVAGTGLGSDVTLAVTQANEFTASAGERKLVFAPLHIRVVPVAFYKWDELQDRFLRAEAVTPDVREANGIRIVGDDDWRSLTRGAKVVERFDLSGDAGENTAKYSQQRELSGTFETSIGFEVAGFKSKISGKCSAKQAVEVTFELAPGRRYELKTPRSVSGFFFG